MNWKKRVVSIILLMTTIITILPAEQVFAETSYTEPDSAHNVASDKVQWSVWIEHSDSLYGSTAYIWTNRQTSYGQYTGVNTPSMVVSSTNDAMNTLLVDSATDGKWDIECSYSAGNNTSFAWRVSTGRPHNFSAQSTNESFMLEVGKIGDQQFCSKMFAILNELAPVDEDGNSYKITESIGNSNIYIYEFVTSNFNKGIAEKDAGKSWFYQRVFCDYNTSTDEFIYTIICYSQPQGENNDYIISGYKSKTLDLVGLTPYGDGESLVSDKLTYYNNTGSGTDYKKIDDAISEVCVDWFDARIKEGILNQIGNTIFDETVSLGTELGTKNISICTDNTTLSQQGLPWVNASDKIAVINALSSMSTDSTYYNTSNLLNCLEIVNKASDDGVLFDVKIKCLDYRNRCDIDTENGFKENMTPSKNPTAITQWKEGDTSYSWVLEKDLRITQTKLSWGYEPVVDLETGGKVDYWIQLVCDTYSYRYALSEAFDLGVNETGAEPPIKYIKHSTSGYYTTSIKGLSDVLSSMSDVIREVVYDSDTGLRAAELIEGMTKEGCLEVMIQSSDLYSSSIDWKELLDSTKIEASSLSDCIYILTYVKYLVDGGLSNVNTIKFSQGNSSTVFLLSDEAISLYAARVDCNKFVDSSDHVLGYNQVEKGTPYNFYGTTDNAYNTTYKAVWSILGFEIPDELSLMRLYENMVLSYNNIICRDVGLVAKGPSTDYTRSYETLKLNEDVVTLLNERIKGIDGKFMVTGTVMNSLPFCYEEFLYSLFIYNWGSISQELSGITEYSMFDIIIRDPFSRAKILDGSGLAYSEYDYLPRLPFLTKGLGYETETVLYNLEYGLAVMNWSTYSDDNETSWSAVDEFLSGKTTRAEGALDGILSAMNLSVTTAIDWAKAGVYDGISSDYLNLFRTIVGVKKICVHLADIESTTPEGIASNWSPNIYNYYKLYVAYSEMFDFMEQNFDNFTMADYTYSNEVEPLGFVARFKDEQFSSQWKYGYAISSHYIPFQTNVYEISAIEALVDEDEWVTEFYYKYGFYRKALYVTTDSEAVVERVLTGKQSGTKIATLRDLLNYERDIELYVDQNFYNANELKVQLDKFIQNASSDSVFGSIFDAIALTPEIILKTGGYTMYSKDLATNVKPIEEISDDTEETTYPYDSFLLSEEDILGEDGFLSAYEYSIQQPYGLVSAIYRTADIYNSVNRAAIKNKPVFTSSKNVVGVQSNNYENYRMFYNYVTLSSLQTLIDHETKLLVDLDAPIFIDIFGNIVTGDGYVIIPAAANATLAGAAFTPYSIGYATFVTNAEETVYSGMTNPFYDWLYGEDYEYLTGMKNLSGKSSTFREICQNTGGGYMHLLMSGHTSMGTTTLTDGVASTMVTWDNLNVKLAVLKDLLMSVHYLNAANFWDDTHINMVIEVLRGAPMEHIDYEAEGINTDVGMTAWQAYWAYKVENLVNAIHTDSNGTEKSPTLSFTFSVLDIFHIESAEKIALLAVKCLLIGFLLLLAAMIVADATVGKMPLNTVWRIVVTCILTGTCISLTPVLADFSLSTTSRLLLQSEASEMLAMRAQKDAEGIEIGVTQTFPVESSTDIIVHVGTLDVAWYDQLLYSMYSSVDNTFEDLYREAAHGVPIANAPYTVRRGKELYIDIGHVMDTTVVQYDATKGVLTNHIAGHIKEEELSASYMLPYYVILDQLVANVNLYNQKYGIQPKNYSVNADGSIRTQDLTYAYFHSDEFLSDTYDILDMARWFNTNSSKIPFAPYFTEEDMSSFNLSIWYPTQADANLLQNSVDALYDKARAYAVNNSEMLSYVSDAAYLKSLAMYLAVEFNSIFDVGIADAFEVKCLDTEDLLRYVIGTPNDVYKFANRTFARYAHEMGGADMSVSAGILYIMFCLTNAIKVASFLIVYIACIGSIIYHRVFKREDSYAMLGFFILIGELTIVNLIYSVLFKVCMNLTRWGVPPLLAIWLVIFFCLLMIVAFFLVGKNGAKNMKQLGRHEVEAVTHFFNNLSGRLHGQRAGAAPSEAVERTVGVLQAHDFSRHENDDFEGNNRDVDDLKAHDRRRRESRVTDDGND